MAKNLGVWYNVDPERDCAGFWFQARQGAGKCGIIPNTGTRDKE